MPIHPEASRKINPIHEKSLQIGIETHQPLPLTHQSQAEASLLEGKDIRDNLPGNLKLILSKLSKRPTNDALKRVICELCSWQALTAQQLAEILNKKDKKHLVRDYLTPLVKAGDLKYVYPERGNSPNQAYVT